MALPTDSQAAATTYTYSTLPEAVPNQHQNTPAPAGPPASGQGQHQHQDHGLPEVVPSEYEHGGHLPQQRMLETGGGLNLPQKYEGGDPHKTEDPHAPSGSSAPPWWKRRLFIAIALVALIAVLALAIGLGVGLTRRNAAGSNSDDGQSSPSQTTTTSTGPFGTPTSFAASVTSQPSACRGTICPSMLATAQASTGGSNSNANFFLFGRGTDQSIWYRKGGLTSWGSDWISLGGTFNSQPAAVSSSNGQRIDVFGTWTDGSVRSKTYQAGAASGGSWTNEWLNLGGSSINAPAACSPRGNSISVFGTNADHLVMYRAFDGETWSPALNDNWTVFGGYTSASIAAVCGTKPGYADIASYGSYAGSLHDVGFMHQINGDWQPWDGNSRPSGSVGYIGDPALVAVPASNTTEFFGIGSDAKMYSVSSASNYSTTRDLGGSFESTPFVLVSEGGTRLDVLAVGQDDRLKHQARLGSTWAGDWEDLGGYFGGVPLAVASTQGWVAVFGIGPGGHVIHGNWTPTAKEPKWGEGSWFDDGKALSSGWLRAGPAK